MWDIGGDAWESFDGVGTLEVTSLSLDESNLEVALFTDDGKILLLVRKPTRLRLRSLIPHVTLSIANNCLTN
ncbi:hypothetical protein MTR_5g064520 [Medicago truncatula]|uniref:Uncharacterized protein n=1 Tax=Medicago truncatula TaxID=3880 RepID=G7KAF9_MEDTR|nr:hypothetical protein MTR_5g064520 [Medicago truncatula]